MFARYPIACVLVLVLSVDVRAEKYALLVGVNGFSNPQPITLDQLQFAEKDAKDTADILRDQGYRVIEMTSATGQADTKLRPTRANIVAQLDELLGTYDPVQKKTTGGQVANGDLVLIALSGHGLQFENDSKNYFLPSDAIARPSEVGTLVALEDIVARLEVCRAEFRLLLVDACRNVIKGNKGPGETLKDTNGVGILLSCRAGEQSKEKAEFKHGVFFHFVIQALSSEEVTRGQGVTWDRVSEHVRANVNKIINSQNPVDLSRGLSRPPVLIRPGKPALLPDGFNEIAARDAQKRWARFLGLETDEVLNLNPEAPPNLQCRIDLALIPPGKFTMGTLDKELPRAPASELPHLTTITQPYFMAKFEVTQQQMRLLKPEHKSAFSASGKYANLVKEFPNTDDLPADTVSFRTANQFCEELNKLLQLNARWKGYVARLPTEAEWEYACRAGTGTAYHFGARCSERNANCQTKSGWQQKPMQQNEHAPNLFGLRNMHGNVAEWCLDWFAPYSGKEETNPTGPSLSPTRQRVLRGGHYNSAVESCRSGARYPVDATDEPATTFGFRFVIARIP